ncbi:LpxL/LpxP family acyltransferase [Acidihalobacter prosperus]
MSQDWRARRERSNAFTLWLIRTLALHGGRWLGRFLLYPITAYYVVTSPASRRASRAYLARVLDHTPGLGDLWRHFFSFAGVLLDRVFFLSGRDRKLDVDIHGAEHLLALHEQGRGAILVGAHVGSFDAARALGRARVELPLRVLMDLEHNPAITRLLDALNPDVAATVIQPGKVDTALRIQEALEAGEFVGILADRAAEAGDKCLEVNFLGSPAQLPLGPMRLAVALHAPVILFLGLYQGGNRYVLHFERLDDDREVPRRERAAYAQTLLRRYAASLEAELRKAPYNWFNFYDFWARN